MWKPRPSCCYPVSFEHLFATIFLWDTSKPSSEFACTGGIQPTRPTTFLTNAYPIDKTPLFTISPEGLATAKVAERKEEVPKGVIAATILYSF